MFLALILSLGLFDLLWWVLADRRLRRARVRSGWHALLALFMTLQFAGYLVITVSRGTRHAVPLPGVAVAGIYLWHLFVQPATLLILLFWRTGASAGRAVTQFAATSNKGEPAPSPALPGPSRRQILVAGAVTLPPLLDLAATGGAIYQQGIFQSIRMDVPVPGLPKQLDGMRIAHVSDSHVGKFTHGAKLNAIANAVDAFDADVVAFTGDLIDFSLTDLEQSIAMARRFGSRYGTYLCEGNHDLFESRTLFESSVKESGLRLLLGQGDTVRIRGQKVQFLGIRWGGGRDRHDARFEENTLALKPRLDPEAFPILLAHHPHAFDAAAEMGVPLTLAGHTHGGQIMLTRNIGPGPLMYKYWSGLYRKPNASLVVSNGVGNWFPLRINAPAQVALLTLRRTV